MPGLVGIISKRSEDECRAMLLRMAASMKHETWYSSGTYCCKDLFVYVGWICQEGEFADCMPITNEAGDVTLFLTGEIFDDPACLEALKGKGHTFRDHDASYLVHLYEERGDAFFHHLNGMYSGVLLDHRQKKVFLFNDRYGMKRLFINQAKDALYFASQAKALLAVLPETREFDPRGLAEYFTCGCALGTQSIYKGIRILPSASCWSLADGAIEQERSYFDRTDWECQERLPARKFTDSVMEIFPAVVKQYGKARLPLGISLTGGLDSRMLVACLDMNPGTYPCYTFGSMYRDTFDVQIAQEVARDCQQSHTALVLGQEFLRDFPRYMEGAVSRSDGFLGLSGAAELYVNTLARHIAPIRLTGNYGSELLRGARAFKATLPKAHIFTGEFESLMGEARQRFEELEAMDPISFALFHQAPCQGYGRSSIENSQVTARTPFMDDRLVRLIYQRPVGYDDGTDLSVSIIASHRPDLIGIPTDRGELGNAGVLARLYRRFDREVQFKAEYWGSHGMPQWVARLTRYAPSLSPERYLLGRHKFQHFQRWLRKELSAYVRDVLMSVREHSDYFDPQGLDSMVEAHMDGRGNFVDEIDKAMTIALSAKLFFHHGQEK
jgi:asparagine synthase (glutamine-hydrolysing)